MSEMVFKKIIETDLVGIRMPALPYFNDIDCPAGGLSYNGIMNKQGLAKRIVLAILLLAGMCVHVVFLFMPPVWTIPASVFVGLSYYLLRISVELLRDGNVKQGVLLFGFEAIIATVVAYGLFIGLFVLLS